MKTQQLANVLIKILGIFFIFENLPVIVSMLLNVVSMMRSDSPDHHYISDLFAISGFGAIQVAIAICSVFWSKRMAGFIFRNEED